MPRSDLPPLTPLGYGAANLGNLHRELSDEQVWAILESAWDSGIRYFDTAPHYGLGLSEQRLGAFLRTKRRNDFVISTKVGRLLRPNPDDDGGLDLAEGFHVRARLRREWDFSSEGIRASLEESLERMGLDRVNVLYLHDPERYDLHPALNEAIPALEQLRSTGVVDAIGVGSMVTDSLSSAIGVGDLDLIMIAGRYTLLEQSAADAVLPACREHGTKAVAASVFNSGVLAKDEPQREDRFEYGHMSEKVWQRLQAIARICRAHNVPLPAVAVQFALRDPVVKTVVVGGSRPEQIRSTAELMSVEIPMALWEHLAADGLIR